MAIEQPTRRTAERAAERRRLEAHRQPLDERWRRAVRRWKASCDEVAAILESKPYRFARTMPECPHWYTFWTSWTADGTEDAWTDKLDRLWGCVGGTHPDIRRAGTVCCPGRPYVVGDVSVRQRLEVLDDGNSGGADDPDQPDQSGDRRRPPTAPRPVDAGDVGRDRDAGPPRTPRAPRSRTVQLQEAAPAHDKVFGAQIHGRCRAGAPRLHSETTCVKERLRNHSRRTCFQGVKRCETVLPNQRDWQYRSAISEQTRRSFIVLSPRSESWRSLPSTRAQHPTCQSPSAC